MRQLVRRVNPKYQHRKSIAWSSLALIGLVAFIVSAQSPSTAQAVPETDLRAAVIVGILRFTEWSQPSNAAQQDVLTVCIWGKAPSLKGLQNNSQPIRIRDQELKIRRATVHEELGACPVVIWGQRADVGQTTTLSSNTLIICDTCDRSRVQAIVSLVRIDNRIHFEVDLNKARTAGISFSSDLLDLARHVEGL